MTFVEVAMPFIELGFPIGVAVYLLWNQSRQIERFRESITKVEIGLYLILAKLDALDEYEKSVRDFEERQNG